MTVVSREDVLTARETIAGRVHRTPTLTSASLAREVGMPVYLKAELFQRTGSFKPRGVLNKLASLSPEEKTRLLKKYWTIPERQIETSVVLVDPKWQESRRSVSSTST